MFKKLYFLVLLSPVFLWGQATTVLEHLQQGETLHLEWAHQQYLAEGGTQPKAYPLYPDQLKDGEGESFVGLKLKMEACDAPPCRIKVWVEYVSSVQFPKRKVLKEHEKKNLALALHRTPEKALIFPLVSDTRYVLDDLTPCFSLGSLDSIPIIVDVEEGIIKEEYDINNNRVGTPIEDQALPASFNYYYLQKFLKSLWHQKWKAKEHFYAVGKYKHFDKLSVNYYKPKHPPKKTIIKGKVLAPITNEVAISGYKEGSWMNRRMVKKMVLNQKGEFETTINLDEPKFLYFFHGFHALSVYVEPGDQLDIELDVNAIYRKTKFKGTNVKANQFLLNFHQQMGDTYLTGRRARSSIAQKTQLDYLKDIKQQEKKSLDFFTNYNALTNDFKQKIKRDIHLFYANALWINSHFFYERDGYIDADYTAYAQQLRKHLFRLPNDLKYDNAIKSYIDFQKKLLKGPYTNQSFPIGGRLDLGLAKVLLSPKNVYRLGRYHLFYSVIGIGTNHFSKYEEIRNICRDTKDLISLEDYKIQDKSKRNTGYRYMKRGLRKGKVAPSWSFPNQKDDTTQLADYKGKYLLLHLGIEDYLPSALADLKEIKDGTEANYEVLSIISSDQANTRKADQENILFITPREMFALQDDYLIAGKSNYYYLIAPDGTVAATPYEMRSFQLLQSAVKNATASKVEKGWYPTIDFWRNLGIGTLLLLLVSSIYTWRKQILAKRERQRRQLAELELKGIRAQMNPHFLFNALSSIQNLIRKQSWERADRYLTLFAGLVRKILDNSEQEFITLVEEIAAIEQYCSLEALRAPFEYEVKIAEDIDPYNTYIPAMLLQPLVENAILHGLMPQQGERNLWIEIEKGMDDALVCQIIDNGIGIKKARLNIQKYKSHRKSYGLALVSQRLNILAGSTNKAFLNIKDRTEINAATNGTIVQLIIPTEI